MRRGGSHNVTMMAGNLLMSGYVEGVRVNCALDQLPRAGVGTGQGGDWCAAVSALHLHQGAAIVTTLDIGHGI